MDFRTGASRSRQKMESLRCSTSTSASEMRSRHPLAEASPVTKDEIRTFPRPASEVWTSLVTTMWLLKAMENLPKCHPYQNHLEERLHSEPDTPTSPASFRTCMTWSFTSTEERHNPTGLAELPYELRQAIYEYSAGQQEPISPVFEKSHGSFDEKHDSAYVRTGLPILHEVFPQLKKELSNMLPDFYRANTFEFDLRGEAGADVLQTWIQDRQDEASSARRIRLKHWTWWFSSNCTWQYTADATTFTIDPNGVIEISRDAGQLDPHSCGCKMHDLVHQCPGWRINKPWTLSDFVDALRQEEELLVQAVTNFVIELVHQHDETLHMWREGPRPCELCGKQAVFFRSLDDVEWTSD